MVRTRDELREALEVQLCAAAANDAVPMRRDYRLGTSGVPLELVAAADEGIGFVLCLGDDPLDAIERRLATAARYCERVALVDASLVEAAQELVRAGAALWAIEDDGGLREHAPGRRNRVSPAAFLDLMPPADRAALLRPLLRAAAYDRARPPLPPDQVRKAWHAAFARPDRSYGDARAA